MYIRSLDLSQQSTRHMDTLHPKPQHMQRAHAVAAAARPHHRIPHPIETSTSATSTPAHGANQQRIRRQDAAPPWPTPEEGYRLTDNECQQRFVSGMRHGVLDAHMTAHLHMRRLDLSHGAAYRTKQIVARHAWSAPQGTAATATSTTHVCLSLNFRSSAWQEGGASDDDDDASPSGVASSLGVSLGKIFGWHSPRMLRGDTLRGLEELASTYVSHYNALSPKKQLVVDRCINAKPDDLTASLRNLRQGAGPNGRLVFHYNGHGVARPRGNYLFLGGTQSNGDNAKYMIDMIRSNAQYPLVFIADCSHAGSMFSYLCTAHKREDELSMQHYRSGGNQMGGLTSSGNNGGGTSIGVPSSALQRASASALDLDPASPCDASGGPSGNGSNFSRSEPAGGGGGGGLFPQDSVTGSPVVPQAPQQLFGTTNPPVRDDFFFIGACPEALPFHALVPNDWLTSCLTTPVVMSLLWFIVTTRSIADLHPAFIHVLPGALEDKKSPLGQLRWAFDSFTESIAWSILRSEQNLFTKLYRQDFLLSSLFRGCLLAQRIASQLNTSIVVYPVINAHDHEHHHLWTVFDFHVERALAALCSALQPRPSVALSSALVVTQHYHKWQYSSLFMRHQSTANAGGNNVVTACRAFREALDKSTALMTLAADRGIDKRMSPIASVASIVSSSEVLITPHFLDEELTSLQTMLDSLIEQGFYRYIPGGGSEVVPLLTGLPMLFQALLVLSHREEGIRLLCRFMDLGAFALEQLVELNVFSEVLKMLWKRPTSVGHRTALMFIYAKAMYQDPSVLSEETRNAAIPVVLSFLSTPVPLSEVAANVASAWQISTLRGFATPVGQVCLAAAITAIVCTRSPQGQAYCYQQGALALCVTALTTQCAPPTPAVGPKEQLHQRLSPGNMAPNAQGSCASPFVTNIEASDMHVLMRLSLLALFCSIVFNCPLEDDATIASFVELMLHCIPTLRSLLGHPFPSVRLAATRAIAIVLSHLNIDATAIESSSVNDRESLEPPVREMVSEFLLAILERCDLVTPFECNTDIRLEQLGILHSVLVRYGARLISGLSSDELQKKMMAAGNLRDQTSSSVAGGRHAPPNMSSSVGHGLGRVAMSADGNPCNGGSYAVSTVMSPFVLPASSISSRTLHLDDSDDERFPRSPFHSGLQQPRLPATVPRALSQRTFDAIVSPQSAPSASLPQPTRNHDLTELLCASLRVLVTSTSDICPVVRAHAQSSLDILRSEQIIPRQVTWASEAISLAHRSSLLDRASSSVSSKKPSSFFLSSYFPWNRKESIATQRMNVQMPTTRANTTSAGSGYRYEEGIDEEESPSLRIVDHRDAATIHPLVFSVLSYLGSISLVPLDDHDPRNPLRAAIQNKTERFGNLVLKGIEHTSRPAYESDPQRRKDPLFLTPIMERDVEAPVAALALHPTLPIVAVATNVDRVQIINYEMPCRDDSPQQQQQHHHRSRLSFHTTALPRTWRERCLPYVMPASPPDPFVGLRVAQHASQHPVQQQQGSSGVFETGSEADSNAENSIVLTPHAHGSLLKDSAAQPSSNLSAANTTADGAAPIVNLHFIDCHRPAPLIAAVHQNGSVAIVALNTEWMLANAQYSQPSVRTSHRDEGTAPPISNFAVRISSFQTMAQEHRALSTSCISSYQSASQQLHVTSPDGTISTWDLAVEQLVGLHNTSAPPHFGDECVPSFNAHVQQRAAYFSGQLALLPTALGSHPCDPFRFTSGSRLVSIFDTRILGGCIQRMFVPKGPSSLATNSVCWHVSYSIRNDHYINAGYAIKGTVLTWDDRMPTRAPFVSHAFAVPSHSGAPQAPPTPQHASQLQHAQFFSASTPQHIPDAMCMDVHATHPTSAVVAATTDSICYRELDTGLTATAKCKGSPKCCIFHPVAGRIAVGTTANRVSVYQPGENAASTIAKHMLDL